MQEASHFLGSGGNEHACSVSVEIDDA